MEKYSFSLTKKEIMKFSIRAVLGEIRYRLAAWLVAGLLVLALCVWEFFADNDVRELANWIMDILAIRWIGVILAAFIIGLIIVMIYRSYFLRKKNLYGKTRTIWVEDELLKVDDGDVYREIPCVNVSAINKKGNLIMLGIYQAEERLSWYSIPFRVFSDVQEMDEFLKKIQYSKKSYMRSVSNWQKGKDYNVNLFGKRVGFGYMKSNVKDTYTMPADDNEDSGESGLFLFSFWIDDERWKRALIDTTEIIRSGVLGSYKKSKVILAVFGVDLAIFICGCFFKIDYKPLFIIFMTLLFLLNLASNNMVNPEKVIKRQWKEGHLQNKGNEKWQVSVSETGVTCNRPNQGRTTISWNKFTGMVETDTAFYLFWADKKQFVMILKECFESYEQAEALKWLCKDKNIAVVMSKKVKYVPYWVFTLLLAVLILIFLLYAVWLGLH